MDSEIADVLERILKRQDSQDFAISAYLRHQRDGPAMRIFKWLVGLFVKGLFGYAMTIWVPRILGWR